MSKHKRVTAYIQDDHDNLFRQGRLVENDDLPQIERVFKMFNIQYEVDEIPPNARLYSLTVTMRDRYISDNLLTEKELKEHVLPYWGKGKVIQPNELKNLFSGKIAEIHQVTRDGEIVAGYELTAPRDDSKSVFRFPLLKFGWRNPKK